MLETKAAFARRLGISRARVTQLDSQGYLVIIGGLVNVEASQELLATRPEHNHGGHAKPMPGVPQPTHFASTDWSLAEAARRKEVAIALKRQLDFDVASGKLINAQGGIDNAQRLCRDRSEDLADSFESRAQGYCDENCARGRIIATQRVREGAKFAVRGRGNGARGRWP